MKIAYLDCASGISGDMMLGALVDAGVSLERLNEAIESLGLPGCRLTAETVKKKGFRATQIRVEYQPEHTHRHLHHILKMIEAGRLSPRQKELAAKIFGRLAEAEAKVHGTTVEKVHFHEVGAADSIADIVGTAVGWDLLGAERLTASAVPTGGGKIQIAHGEVSVPAPATAELLRGVPLAASAIEKELTTPTGAAILATLAAGFGPLPAMRLAAIGYGAGQRDLEQQPNVLRLLVGDAEQAADGEQVWVLETNLDDTTGELIGYCIARLWEAGALDVYTTAIQMKKNRPGVILSVLCLEEHVEAISAILFSETTTLGVRRWPVRRQVLRRQAHAVETQWGRVEGKVGRTSDEQPRFSPEYESCRQVAQAHNVPLRAVYEAAQQAFDPSVLQKQVPSAMQQLAGTNVVTGICMVVLLLAAGVLLFRTQRYFARQARNSPYEPPGEPTGKRAEPMPDALQRWEIEMHDLARELSGRLDSKMSVLQHLTGEADRAAARLESALAAAGRSTGAPPEPQRGSQAEKLLSEASSPGAVADDAGAKHSRSGRYDEIYMLADYGHAPAEIAKRLGLPIGEIELILSLRTRR